MTIGVGTTNRLDNVYRRYRIEASRYNEKLKGREGAAELLGVAPTTVSDWELGISKPSPDSVLRMADVYNAPELLIYYCRNVCPVGCMTVPNGQDKSLESITLNALALLDKVDGTQKRLVELTKDGTISDDERTEMNDILSTMNDLEGIIESLKIWCKKHETR